MGPLSHGTVSAGSIASETAGSITVSYTNTWYLKMTHHKFRAAITFSAAAESIEISMATPLDKWQDRENMLLG